MKINIRKLDANEVQKLLGMMDIKLPLIIAYNSKGNYKI